MGGDRGMVSNRSPFFRKSRGGGAPETDVYFCCIFFFAKLFLRLAVRLIAFIINVWFESEHEHLRVSIIKIYIYIYIPHRPSCHSLR